MLRFSLLQHFVTLGVTLKKAGKANYKFWHEDNIKVLSAIQMALLCLHNIDFTMCEAVSLM